MELTRGNEHCGRTPGHKVTMTVPVIDRAAKGGRKGNHRTMSAQLTQGRGGTAVGEGGIRWTPTPGCGLDRWVLALGQVVMRSRSSE